MTTIELGYGANTVAFDYDEARFELLVPAGWSDPPLSDAEIGYALDNPIASPVLEEIVAAGDSALIVVSDATRATATAQIVNLLVRRLIQAGISPGDLAIIFATGIHRTPNDDEKRELLTPFIAQRIRIIEHNATDPSQLIRLGETSHGTPVEVNRALKDYSHVILTGGVGFHYFAGFTGGRKSVCPGLASAQTIEATHMLALDLANGGRRAGVAAGQLQGNAVHEECQRVTESIAPSFLINTIVDERGRARKVFAGNWRAAHRRACDEYTKGHTQRIAQKRAVVVVSCGGSPYDINLIQAHKALDMAAHACLAGGSIVLLAECADGLGRFDFMKWFECADSRALEQRLRETYEVNGQTAWALLTKTEQFRVCIISKLADADVRRMRMIPARSLKEALAEVPPATSGYLMPRGAAVLPITIN